VRDCARRAGAQRTVGRHALRVAFIFMSAWQENAVRKRVVAAAARFVSSKDAFLRSTGRE